MPDRREEPVLREADVPAWSAPTLLERIENALRGDSRPSPTRRQFAEGVAGLGAMFPPTALADAKQKISRAEDGDWIDGALGMTMAGRAAAPMMRGMRSEMARRGAARWGAGGAGVSAPISEGLRDDDTAGGRSGGVISAPSPARRAMVPVDLDGREYPYGELPPLRAFRDDASAYFGFAKGGKVDRLNYWDSVPLGWVNPYSRDVQDYISTELNGERQIRPALRQPRHGLDPLGEGREEMFRQMRGYEDGGEVEAYEPEYNAEDISGGDGYISEDDLKALIEQVLKSAAVGDEQPA